MSSQDRLFVEAESDRYFERNQATLRAFDAETDLPLRLIGLYGLEPASVLEVGAANGPRVGWIGQRTGAQVVAVEPSSLAIADGRSQYPWVNFIQAEAAAIPLCDAFDLVIVNFVLHWIGRSSLFKVVAEIDRLVKNGGNLLIGDFNPAVATRVPYHHLPHESVYTFKQDYSSLFVSSLLYHQVAMITSTHSDGHLQAAAAENERVSVWLLRKQLHDHYARS